MDSEFQTIQATEETARLSLSKNGKLFLGLLATMKFPLY
jgi:hypothetical protein